MRIVRKVLHVSTQGIQLKLEGGSVVAKQEGKLLHRLPLQQIEAIHLYGSIGTTTSLIHRSALEGPSIVWFTRAGRFVGRVQSGVSGNVLLRQAQYESAQDKAIKLAVSKNIVAVKILNSRGLLDDAAKDRSEIASSLREAAKQLTVYARNVKEVEDLNTLRGIEGQSARLYFKHLSALLVPEEFNFSLRTRRPPLDPTNALLSFCYGIMRIKCVAACEAVGLDPQLGFLHDVRPGRQSLALDLLEEFRAPFVDRFVVNIINRKQVQLKHFDFRPGGAVELKDEGRKVLFSALDSFMSAEVECQNLDCRSPRAFVAQQQAALLARHLRKDMQQYIPFRAVGR